MIVSPIEHEEADLNPIRKSRKASQSRQHLS